MNALTRKLCWLGASVLTLTHFAAAVMAQGRNDAADGGGSLAALTSELRQLRMAVRGVDEKPNTGAGLGCLFVGSAESYVLQVATRLDSAPKGPGGRVHPIARTCVDDLAGASR